MIIWVGAQLEKIHNPAVLCKCKAAHFPSQNQLISAGKD